MIAAPGIRDGQRARGRKGFSLSSIFSLLAVVSVVIVVSLPRLRRMAAEENEADACSTALQLARNLGDSYVQPPLRELLGKSGAADSLCDAEWLEDGAVLRRHGYLFEVARLPVGLSLACTPFGLYGHEVSGGLFAIRAWPWKAGATGEAAYLATGSGVLLARRDLERSWEGLQSARAAIDWTGWSRIR